MSAKVLIEGYLSYLTASVVWGALQSGAGSRGTSAPYP